MTTSTCPRGHESATMDYCDVCGAPMAGRGPGPDQANSGPEPVGAPGVPEGAVEPRQSGGGSVAAQEPSPAKRCPLCGTPQVDRFCEEDGYDFLLSPPVPAAPDGAAEASSGEAAGVPDEGGQGPEHPGTPASRAAGTDGSPQGHVAAWQIVVGADRDYFEIIRALGGADAAALNFPRFVPERLFVLDRRQLLIGRRSRSRGVRPDIDLIGPPEDPGVSHLHALLVPQSDGWALVDLESANGTYLNDPATASIAPNTPVPLGSGDRIYLGAWTVLTIRLDG
ncbi:FHA domain-containing protein [Plantactinospora solaniradicis]|uniref:FHA domain-containing protein n=1 Tax=Plantactinospora solaniradicis TaxID=1723736 RepID=A0ABW1K212_9ACTN